MNNVAAMNTFWVNWAMIPARISDAEGLHTLLTHMFLHGGLLHLAGNMLFLHIFGDNVEDRLGHLPFLIFYLACGLLAGLTQYGIDPSSGIPTVGASGAIAGVMGGYLLLFPRARVDILIIIVVIFKVLPIPAWILLAVWFAMQFMGGLGASSAEGGVAYWAHAGGFVAGIVLILPLWLRLGGPSFWKRTSGHPDHPEASYRIGRSRIPKIRRR
jgi:membrane associated rhomboid family serine protease